MNFLCCWVFSCLMCMLSNQRWNWSIPKKSNKNHSLLIFIAFATAFAVSWSCLYILFIRKDVILISRYTSHIFFRYFCYNVSIHKIFHSCSVHVSYNGPIVWLWRWNEEQHLYYYSFHCALCSLLYEYIYRGAYHTSMLHVKRSKYIHQQHQHHHHHCHHHHTSNRGLVARNTHPQKWWEEKWKKAFENNNNNNKPTCMRIHLC